MAAQPSPKDEFEFHRLLNILARLTSFELDEDVISFYDQSLARYGYGPLCRALSKILAVRGSREPFPSVADIEKHVNPTVSSEAIAEDAVARIMASVGRRGYTWGDMFKHDGHADFTAAQVAELGEVGAEIVRRFGGWLRICQEVNESGAGVIRAQVRRLANSVIELSQAGKLAEASQLPKPQRDEPLSMTQADPRALVSGLLAPKKG